VPLDRHDSNRCTVGADDRDPVASGMADDPAMGQLDVVSVRADDFSGIPVQGKGFHRVVGSADDRRGTVVARDIDARPVGAHDNVLRVGTGARGRDDVVQTADDLDRIIHHDVDVIGAYRDFARPAPKRNRRDDGPAACRPWPSTSSAMASTVHKWAHIGHCSETRVPAFLRRYCQWVWQSLFRHCEQSRPRLQLGQGSPARLLLSASGSIGKWFTASPYRAATGFGATVTNSPRLRVSDKITSSHAPLSRVTVTASR
jgi:hypothetical protein